ncbi:MAG: ABC transporter substrate-binding protein [Synechococcus sp. ArSW.bin.68]
MESKAASKTDAIAKMFHLLRLRTFVMKKRAANQKSVLRIKPIATILRSNSLIAIGLSLSIASTSAQQRDTQTPSDRNNTILLGQSLPLSGPSAQIGKKYQAGAQAWFNEVNRKGGINGKKIRLISLDDQYEPELTISNTKTLLEEPNLLALFGYVGTPTTKEILPLIEERKVPLIAPLTGASILRDEKLKMVVNLRASYQMEIDKIVDSLVRNARQKIAIVYQDDAFGKDGLRSSELALKKHGLKPIAIATVQRNSAQIRSALQVLTTSRPNAIIIISTYVSSAALSKELLQRDIKAQIMNVSFVGTRALEQSLPVGLANGIGVSQVVPFPWDRWIPVVADYQRLMRVNNSSARFGFTSLEGFIAARLITEGIKKVQGPLTKGSLITSLKSIKKVDIGGFQLDLSSNKKQASDYVELTFFGTQQWEP